LKIVWILITIFGLLIAPKLVFASAVSANIPLHSPIYQLLDKLEGVGLIDSGLHGMRPVSRLEAARQIVEARSNAADGEAAAVTQQILHRLENELHDQLVELHALEGEAPDSYIKPLRSLEANYVYQDGVESVTPLTNAHQFALNYNNSGTDYDNRHNGQLIFNSEARIAQFFLLEVRPTLEFRDQEGTDLQLLEGRAALGLGPVEISFGRQSLWWGQGSHGSLVLTNNAEPLDMLRLTNPNPVLLPWILEYLGPFRFDVFWSRLENDRVVAKPYFAGLRFDFKPLPWFELGASRTVILGGEGRPSIGWDEFLTILGGKNLNGGADTSNSLAALDLRLKIPFLAGSEFYGELGGEDEANHFFSKDSWIIGAYLPWLEPTGRFSLRIEYADLSSPVWYRHTQYRSGYTFEGKIMGHHVGGAGKDIYSELRVLLHTDLTLSLSLDIERRGYDQPVREQHLEPGAGVEWQLRPDLSLSVRYSYDQVENFGFVSGDDRTFHLAGIRLRTIW